MCEELSQQRRLVKMNETTSRDDASDRGGMAVDRQ